VQQIIFQGGRATFIPASWLAHDAIFPAMLASLLALAVVSAFTQAPAKEKWAPFFAEDTQ